MRNAVDSKFERRLAGLINSGERAVLRGGRKGVEKESLRVSPGGEIVQTPHPPALGAPLTNEHITTDFSEALIELVTPPFQESWALLQYLCDIHQFVYRHLGDELLWATSMPGAIVSDERIPLAQFGTSNVGRMKTIYRHGLGERYGRIMQAISGVHFNFSFADRLWETLAHIHESRQPRQDFISGQYFGVLRNYRRFGWLVLYLFGTSPAVSKSFFAGRTIELATLDRDSVYEPFGTSLRMSDIGYRNKNQASVSVSVNSLDEYVRDLSRAIGTPYPPYEKIGVKVDGEYRQLNANILQIENEYDSMGTGVADDDWFGAPGVVRHSLRQHVARDPAFLTAECPDPESAETLVDHLDVLSLTQGGNSAREEELIHFIVCIFCREIDQLILMISWEFMHQVTSWG